MSMSTSSTVGATVNYSAMGTHPGFVNQPMMSQTMGVRMGMGQPMGMGLNQPMGMGMSQPMGMGMTQPMMTNYGGNPAMYGGSYQMGAMNWSQGHK